ncbi:ATPase, BadF/BadG/BcrA/BcrD type [Candidatus Vecturithrix granuli]|uniref:ATPase, BadF/BadG/BcrA/BcrD type n=1 Tax=Vecturithrix granuli TaxID=1499967 RepID=A0A081C2H9_VECG1|nr:ATPase, BadF/BadG/BcrA/BcrD type [Candidatus Vecturithrix granuli]
MKHFIGIDIGNTKTLYVLADETGDVKSVYYGRGANYQGCGREQAIAILQAGFSTLLQQSGCSFSEISGLYYGAAGADTSHDFEMLRNILASVTPSISFDFENDGWISLKSGTIDGIGMVVTCGSGNTNFAMNARGQRKRIGGLCEYLGDVLGAYRIAHFACSAAMRSADGRAEPTILTRMIPDALEVKQPEDIINLPMNAATVKTVIQTFFKAAEMGDGKALEITWMLTKEVLTIVREFSTTLFTLDEQLTLVLDGPVFRAQYQPLMRMIELALRQRYHVNIIVPQWDPVVGALFYALENGGIQLTNEISQRIIQTYCNCLHP